jgi:predicted transcriptional regulator
MALQSRPTREQGLRNCALILDDNDSVELIGKVEPHVRETFELLRERRTLTARDVAERWELDINAASTRLKALFDLGLALRTDVRDAHGKQYRYMRPI